MAAGQSSCQCSKWWLFDLVFDKLENTAQKAHNGGHITHKPSLCALGDVRCLCGPYELHFFFPSINSNPAKTSQCLQNLTQPIWGRGFSVFRLIKCKTLGEDLTKSMGPDLESVSVMFFLGYAMTVLIEVCGAWPTLLDRQPPLCVKLRPYAFPVHMTSPATYDQTKARYSWDMMYAKHLGYPPCYALLWHSINRNRIILSTLIEGYPATGGWFLFSL